MSSSFLTDLILRKFDVSCPVVSPSRSPKSLSPRMFGRLFKDTDVDASFLKVKTMYLDFMDKNKEILFNKMFAAFLSGNIHCVDAMCKKMFLQIMLEIEHNMGSKLSDPVINELKCVHLAWMKALKTQVRCTIIDVHKCEYWFDKTMNHITHLDKCA